MMGIRLHNQRFGGGGCQLPVDNWVKGFMGMGMTFSIGSSFTLAKTIRDNHEAYKLISRVDEARVEKLLADHDLLK